MTAQDHDRYMDLAVAEAHHALAEGNEGYGAVVVRGGEVVGTGHNTAITEADPTNHAEVAAIRDACRRLGSGDLSGATLYASMEPCPMCLWAIMVAGVERLVLGARHAEREQARESGLGRYSVEALLEMTGRRLDLVTGVRTAECRALMGRPRT